MTEGGWRDGLQALVDKAVDQLKRWDTTVARKTLREFERAHGLDLRTPRVVNADLPAVRRALAPEDRPLVEHHWAMSVPSAVDSLAKVEAIAGRVHERADVVGVVWDGLDRFEGRSTRSAGALRHEVEGFCAERRVAWPNLVVVDADVDALREALRLPAGPLPVTRVLDPDGGVLRTFVGPLTDADVDAVLALVGA